MNDRLIDILKLGTEYLQKHGVESSRLEAEILLSDGMGKSRLDLYLDFDHPLDEKEKDLFRKRLKRRVMGEPLQYITGHTDFYGYRFVMRPGVLIARPETEMIIELSKKIKPDGFGNVLDVGCGSGVIGLTLLAKGIAEKVTAIDVSKEAVDLTMENAIRLKVDSKELTVIQADVFAKKYLPPGAPFDLVVSNPPYIRNSEWHSLPPHIREHEPQEALLSGDDGLNAHRALASVMKEWLKPGGMFLGEIGAEQGEQAQELHNIWAASLLIHKDLAGYDRI
ncbi:MAG: peptide chain release factor N(5)-glutamine methyltransferase, partial [Candidatus Electryonea clarkiae]|nr:peptide chain release factor N(5)-glutamine methyltransferase [Candidatus Electryonea clarkiae]